jgi:hypothetical protein
MLTEAVKKFGKDWSAIAALVPGRTNKQVSLKMGLWFGSSHYRQDDG